jgi:predicted nucleotidyltransferase
MTKHGLTLQQIEVIAAILRPYADKIKTVGLFGSRAQGTYRSNSDIDMVIKGEMTKADIDRLYTLFDESSLPFKVDVNAYDLIDYPPLKDHIDAVFFSLLTQADVKKTGV